MTSHAAFSPNLSRRSLMKGGLAAALGLGLASALPMAAAPAAAQASEAGVFTMAISFMPSSLQPSSGGNDDQTMVVRPIYECLFQELAGTDIEYHLVDDLQVSDDGLTYTLHVRDNATWSDGEPVTVSDIMFAIDYSGRNYDGKTSITYVNGQAVTFTEQDDKTLQIVLPETYCSYIYSLNNITPIPAHAFDNDYTKVDEVAAEYFFTPGMVTSGAYTVEQINEDSIVYAAREDYYGGAPQVKTLVAKTIGSGSTRQLAFENSEIDYLRVTSAEDLQKYQADPDTYSVCSFSEARLNYLQVSTGGPVISTLGDDARKAIFLALNGQEIVDFAYGTDELATPANSLLTPDQEDYDADCPGYTQDLETAKQLAESSGLAGQTLTYIFNSDRPNMEQVAVVIQQELQAIGVNLNIEALDSTSFFARFFKDDQANTWDLGTNGWDSERGRSARQCAYYLRGTFMSCGFSQEVADAATAANGEADAAARKEQWRDIQAKALEEYWEYPLTYTNYVMVSRKNVSGLDASPIVPEFSLPGSITVE